MKIENLMKLFVTKFGTEWDVEHKGFATITLSAIVPINSEETRLKFAEILEDIKKPVNEWNTQLHVGLKKDGED